MNHRLLWDSGGAGECFRQRKRLRASESLTRWKSLPGRRRSREKKEQVKHGTLLNEEAKKKHDELFDLYIIGA